MIRYLRFLSGRERTREANRHLGLTLAFVAGAVNAGGFLAIAQYTSHMTGVLSSVADNLALGRGRPVLAGLCAFTSFVAGACFSAILIQWARRRKLHSEYALALLVEAALLVVFGLLGRHSIRTSGEWIVLLLCFVMGLQNAIITKVSGAEIRTTHMTGNATDLGIELGRLLFGSTSDREKLKLHASLIALFTLGGVIGALGFKGLGYGFAAPLAALLLTIAVVPVWEDLAPSSQAL